MSKKNAKIDKMSENVNNSDKKGLEGWEDSIKIKNMKKIRKKVWQKINDVIQWGCGHVKNITKSWKK